MLFCLKLVVQREYECIAVICGMFSEEHSIRPQYFNY